MPPPRTSLAAVPDFPPRWARRAIWYQIFPERFCNGDPRNDPTVESLGGADHCEPSAHWQVHPWTSDWYELAPYERAEGGPFWRHALRRRYGGDLAGILQRLDYLQDLGVTALYLNPVFEAPSAHKYDGSTYHHIDPHFGPDPAGDRARIAAEIPDDPTTWVWTRADELMLELIAEVHRRDMRIIFDGVFNHMGVRSWAFLDVVQHQQRSRFADWFKVTSWRDAAGAEFAYEGWFGHLSLPELRQDPEGIVAGPRDYIFAATARWMAPDGKVERGIDGWRLDVALQVRHGFWKAWRTWVKSINPEAYLTGEIIAEPAAAQPFLRGDEFDAVMNYPFAFACHEAFFADPGACPMSELDRRLAAARAAHPPGATAVMQNLFGSHDTARLASHAVNGSRLNYRAFPHYAEQQARATSPGFEVRAPNAQERQRQRLFVLFQMTYLGAPMIYYGDEAGMWGATDPCCRKPMVWPELTYQAEASLPDGSVRARPDPVAFDHAWFAEYRRLIALRRSLPPLCEGTFTTLHVDDARHLLAFARDLGPERVVVAINRSAQPQRLTLEVAPSAAAASAAAARWRDALSGDELTLGAGGLELELAPWWGVVAVRA